MRPRRRVHDERMAEVDVARVSRRPCEWPIVELRQVAPDSVERHPAFPDRSQDSRDVEVRADTDADHRAPPRRRIHRVEAQRSPQESSTLVGKRPRKRRLEADEPVPDELLDVRRRQRCGQCAGVYTPSTIRTMS